MLLQERQHKSYKNNCIANNHKVQHQERFVYFLWFIELNDGRGGTMAGCLVAFDKRGRIMEKFQIDIKTRIKTD